MKGDDLPVSAIPDDGTWPTATTKYEQRNIAVETPEWDSSVCIQCAQCSLVCPHAAIRTKVMIELGWVEVAMGKLDELQGCEVHMTHIPTPGDEAGLRRIGVNLTSDPNFSTKDLFIS